jgi:hypothetical protein
MATQEPVVRDYVPADFEQVRAIHERMQMDYLCPDLTDCLFVVKKVLESDGEIIAVTLARIEFETYLLLEPSLSPLEKNLAMQALQPEFLKACRVVGAESVVAWIPENVEKKFAKRLNELGWQLDRPNWRTWSRRTDD